jgi:hypothetical protein
MKIVAIDKSRLAKTIEEYHRLLASEADWIARNADDVRQLRNKPPFSTVPDRDFEAFVAGLVFGRGGIVGANYRPLMYSLTMSEIYEIFANFGIATDLATRSLEFKAAGTGCSFDFWSICLNETKPQQ